MAQYGRTTAGASWLTVEARYSALTITVPGTETATKMSAYLRSVGSATGGLKMALYTQSTNALAYESSVLSGFTDTTGGWKDFTFTSSVAAGTYRLVVIGDAVAGGVNTVEIAYDTVGSDTSLYQYYFFGGSWPTLDTDLDGLEVPGGTHNVSLYLETSAGGSSPVLSAPTPSGILATQTTATIGASTDTTSGTGYCVVDSAANLSGVTAAEIKLGQKAGGTAALAAGNVAVSASPFAIGVTGLSANTTYSYAIVQNSSSDSNVVTGTFSTNSGLDPITVCFPAGYYE